MRSEFVERGFLLCCLWTWLSYYWWSNIGLVYAVLHMLSCNTTYDPLSWVRCATTELKSVFQCVCFRFYLCHFKVSIYMITLKVELYAIYILEWNTCGVDARYLRNGTLENRTVTVSPYSQMAEIVTSGILPASDVVTPHCFLVLRWIEGTIGSKERY